MGLFDKAKGALGKAAQAVANVCNTPDEAEEATPAKDEAAQNRTENATRQKPFAARIMGGTMGAIGTITGGKRAEEKLAADRAAREAEEAAKKAEEVRKAEEAKKLCETEGHLPAEKFSVPDYKDGLFAAMDKDGCLLGKCPRCGAISTGEKVCDLSFDGFPDELTCDAVWNCDGEWINVGKYTVKLKKEACYCMVADKNWLEHNIRRGDPFLSVYAESESFEPNEDFPFGAEPEKQFILKDEDGELLGGSSEIMLYDEKYYRSLPADKKDGYWDRIRERYLIPAKKGYSKLSVYAGVGKK